MSKEPKRNIYVGHRYVPKIMGEWDKTETYEGLSIVTNKGTSYTSKKRVPKGIDILNEEYWVVTGNYNAQIEEYRQYVRDVEIKVNEQTDKLDLFNNQLLNTMEDLEDRGVNVGAFGNDDVALNTALNTGKHIVIPKNLIITLNETVNIPDNVTISGGGTIKKSGDIKYGLHIIGNNVTIGGIIFNPSGVSGNPHTDIKIGDGVKNVKILNNIFNSSGNNRIYSAIASADDVDIGGTDFPYIRNVEGLIIEGNIFEGYSRPLYLYCIDNFTIVDNIFKRSIFDAIRIREAMGHGIINENQFIDTGDKNAIDDQTRDAIDTGFSGNKLIISNNIVKGTGKVGFDIKGVDRVGLGYSTRTVIISGNIIERTKYEGIMIGESSNSAPDYLTNFIVSNNHIIECNQKNINGEGSIGVAGILIKSNVRYVTISENHCISNYGRGISVARYGGVDIENNHHINIVDNICINNTDSGIYLLDVINAIVSRNHCVNDTNVFTKQQGSGPIFKNRDAQMYGISILTSEESTIANEPNIIITENILVNNTSRQMNYSSSNRYVDNIFTLRDNIERGSGAYGEGSNRERWSAQGRIFWSITGAIPTASEGNFKQGDIIFRKNPTAGGRIGSVCVEGGNPGVWKGFGNILE